MILAAADTTFVAAFAVGFASFVSPCVLPLVPGYLSAVSGVSVRDMQTGDRPLSRVLWPSLVFCLSFTVIFVALGMTATGLGSLLADNRDLLEKIAGTMIVVLGVYFLATPFLDRLNVQWRPETLMMKAAGGPVIAGAAFAIAWTPCIGPTLGAILTAASTAESVGRGGALLAMYSLGLAIPFLLCAIAFDRATTAFRWIRDHYAIVNVVSGSILVAMGLLLLTGELATLNIEAQKLLDDLGLDFIYSL